MDSTRITYIEPWNSVRRMNNIVPMFSTFSTMASAESQNEGFLLTKILKITPLDQKNVAGHKNTERTSSSWEGLTKKGSRDLPPSSCYTECPWICFVNSAQERINRKELQGEEDVTQELLEEKYTFTEALELMCTPNQNP